MYLVASGVTDKNKKRPLLLYQAGLRVCEIFCQLPDNGNDDDFDTAVAKLNAYFELPKHRLYDFINFDKPNRTTQRHSINIIPDCEVYLSIVILPTPILKSCFKSYFMEHQVD